MAHLSNGETGISLPDHHIRICTPIYSDTDDQHKLSLVDMSKQAHVSWEYGVCQSCMPALARNYLVTGGKSTHTKQTLDARITHYLFVDADVSWLPIHVERLLAHRHSIVSGSYISRDNNRCYEAGYYDTLEGNPGQHISAMSKGLNRVDWVGAGFMLVARQALETMEYPWYRHHVIRHLEQVEGGLIPHSEEVNEDIGFCLNAKAHGFTIWLDCDCVVQHHIDAEVPPIRMMPTIRAAHIGNQPVHVTHSN